MACNILSCVCGKVIIPQRYVMMVMISLALLNSYHLRVVLNVAITEMVAPKNRTNGTEDACPEFHHEPVEVKGETWDWPDWITAFVKYAFYIGYVITHIPGGWLADKFGPRHVMGTCMFISTASTLLLPILMTYGGDISAIVLRAILGLAQGPIYPTSATLLQNWVLPEERGLIGGVAYAGGNMGSFTGNLFTGMIIKGTKSWAAPFYIYGGITLGWYILYLFYIFSRPSTHPFITDGEKDKLSNIDKKMKFKVPWIQLFLSLPIWASFASHFGHNYVLFTIVTDLPKYIKDILKMDVQANAIFTSLPFLALWLSNVIISALSDVIINRGWFKILTIRKAYTFVGNVGPACCMLLAVYVGCTRVGAITLYTLGLAVMAPYYTGTMVNINDLSKNYSGIIMALVNGSSSIAGVIGPFMVGHLTRNKMLSEWRLVFWIMFGICMFTSVLFIIFADAKRQPWDYAEGEEKEE